MKKLFIDVDEVICDSGFLGLMNEFLNTNYTINQFTTYYIEEEVMTKEQISQFYDFIKGKNFYEKASLLPGAKETIEKLNKKYDIYICSSCAIDVKDLKYFSGDFFKHKYEYLLENLPFLDVSKFIFTSVKNIFDADIQIDDKISNLISNVPQKFLFTAYHNRNITTSQLQEENVTRVNSWKEIEQLLL